MHQIRMPEMGKTRGLLWLLAAVFSLIIGLPAASDQQPGGAKALVRQRKTAEENPRGLEARAAADDQALRSYQVADLFGESDEEKAARLQHEQAQDGSIAGLRQRMDDVENSLIALAKEVGDL